MTDNKRQSTVGNIATANAINEEEELYKAIGKRVRVTCAVDNKVLEGTLFTACNITNAIAINSAPAPPNPSASLASQPGNWHIIPFAHILNFKVFDSPGERIAESGPGFDSALPSISKIDLDALKAREENTIREIKRKDALKGKGVTKEAQEVFDFLARTLPTRWHETTIVVNDAVLLHQPYTVDNLQAPKDKQQAIGHVRKVLENYYQRKKTQGVNRAPVATPIAPRKGG
jgi:hypothetical protein